MTLKAVFYLLSDATLKARDLYACRLIDKAYLNNQTIYINLNDIAEVQNFDTQLWTFRDISFVPHEIYHSGRQSEAPVVLGTDELLQQEAPAGDILVNLAIMAPAGYAKFSHIIEIIPNEEQLKNYGRKKYKIYQEHGYQITTFNIQL